MKYQAFLHHFGSVGGVGGGDVGGWVGGGDVGGGGVGVGFGLGYYNFPRSTNKIKSFDEISTSDKNYIFLHFSVVGEGQT